MICRVKFIPIAGYQPDNPGIRLMPQTDEIEVWLIPVRGTYMYVPYRIVLPTPVGYGSALVTSIQVAARAAPAPSPDPQIAARSTPRVNAESPESQHVVGNRCRKLTLP